MLKTILIVEDEAAVRFGIRDFLEEKGFEVAQATSCQEAQEVFRATRPSVVILDYALPDGSALTLLRPLKQIDPTAAMIILTAHGSIDLAVRAIKEGAEQFLTKPVELNALLAIIRRLIDDQRNRRRQLTGQLRASRDVVNPFLGNSVAIRELEAQAAKAVTTDSPVLIQGETGVGKGVLAAWLHSRSPRAEEPFVDLNCAALSRELLESELFGHEKGAFTGAVATKTGLLEAAHGGTVFLDEIGDMAPDVQPRLLKVLEDQRFRRLGDVRDRRVNVRLLVASHRDLEALMSAGQFRSDLYYRISTIPLAIPPLRVRAEDIPVIAGHLLTRCAADLGRRVELAPDAVRLLQSYAWPGNIRELRNVLERAVLLSDRPVLHRDDLRLTPRAPEAATSTRVTLRELERRHIEQVLREEGGHVEAAARRLGIPRSSLYQKIKQHGIVSRV